jgi:hypothetical protein
MVLSLSGKDIINKWNLSGKTNQYLTNIPLEIKKLKIKIMDTLVLPLFSKQWKVMKENVFMLDNFKEKIDYYYNTFKIDEILLYRDIINLCEVFINQYDKLEDIQTSSLSTDSSNNNSNSNSNKNAQSISFIYTTTMIKLKPEYELYDSILGKPKKQLKQKYNEDIISDIQKLMILDSITYQKIKTFIEKKYITIL